MWATWFQGTYEEFIAANLDGYANAACASITSSAAPRSTSRASAPSRRPRCRSRSAPRWKASSATCSASAGSTISWKSAKANGAWCWRRLTYEKDSIVPVDPTKAPKLDPKLLARFPVGYQPPRLSADQGRLQGEGRTCRASMGRRPTRSTRLGADWLKGSTRRSGGEAAALHVIPGSRASDPGSSDMNSGSSARPPPE